MNLKQQFFELLNQARANIASKAPFDLYAEIKGEYEDEESALFDLPYVMCSDKDGYFQIHAVLVSMDNEGNIKCLGTSEEFGEEFYVTFDDLRAETVFELNELLNELKP